MGVRSKFLVADGPPHLTHPRRRAGHRRTPLLPNHYPELSLEPRGQFAAAFRFQSPDHVADLLATAGLGISTPLSAGVRARSRSLVRRPAIAPASPRKIASLGWLR